VLSEVSVAYLVENQAPKIIELKIENQPAGGGGGESQPQPGKVTLPPRLTTKKITWQAQDPDNDPFGVRIYYRQENEEHWVLLNPDSLITGNEYIWNTESVPDGKYLIKVEVTDEKANPPERALKDERISLPILVDNTKPVIKELEISEKKLICSGVVEDNFSYINRIEYAIDGGDWHLIYPEDNFFDQPTEQFSFRLGELILGSHIVVVRAFDSMGNMGVAQKTFKVNE
jgi:hypothetical protein